MINKWPTDHTRVNVNSLVDGEAFNLQDYSFLVQLGRAVFDRALGRRAGMTFEQHRLPARLPAVTMETPDTHELCTHKQDTVTSLLAPQKSLYFLELHVIQNYIN